MSNSYYDQLKDPRWQKKRLEILQKHDWICSRCWASDRQLHVHHTRYKNGCRAWEYDDSDLIVLCDQCHSEVKSISEYLSAEVSKNLYLHTILFPICKLAKECTDASREKLNAIMSIIEG